MTYLFRRSWILVAAFGCADPGSVPGPGAPEIKASDLVVWTNPDVRGESVPVFDSSTVYHLQQEVHIVAAVDRRDGSLKWRRTLPVSLTDVSGYGLALAGGVLVVGDLAVFGLDPETGRIMWTFMPTEGLYPGYSTLAAVGSTVYCGSTTGHVYALDATTGKQLWVTSFLPQYTQVFKLKVVEGVIYAGFTQLLEEQNLALGGVVAIDARTGTILWRSFAPQAKPSDVTTNTDGVAVTPSLVVMGTNRAVYGLDRRTGAIKVTVPGAVFGDVGPGDHTPLYTGSHILVGTSAPGTLTALDPVDLHKVWTTPAEGHVTSMVASNGYVYLTRVFSFERYRLADGVRMWKLIGADIGLKDELYLAAPALDATRLYLPGTKAVHAFKRE